MFHHRCENGFVFPFSSSREQMLIFAKMSDCTSLNPLHALLLFHSSFYAHQVVLLRYNMESTTDKECEFALF